MTFDDKERITATEIQNYTYCSMNWFLERCGFKPETPEMRRGTEFHRQLGEKITEVQQIESTAEKSRNIGSALISISIAVGVFLLLWILLV